MPQKARSRAIKLAHITTQTRNSESYLINSYVFVPWISFDHFMSITSNSQLEVQWAYSWHLVHLQWGTVHALHSRHTVLFYSGSTVRTTTHCIRQLHFELELSLFAFKLGKPSLDLGDKHTQTDGRIKCITSLLHSGICAIIMLDM